MLRAVLHVCPSFFFTHCDTPVLSTSLFGGSVGCVSETGVSLPSGLPGGGVTCSYRLIEASRLLDFLDGVSGSVFASDQRIALLGIIAYEAAGFRIEFHPVAHPDGLVLGIDLMGV